MGADSGAAAVTEHPAGEYETIRHQKPPLRQRVIGHSRFWASRFFPWSVEKEEIKIQDVRKSRFVPWVGILALIGSALTILFSWIVLHVIDGKPQVESSYLKPASWLSAILSANSVLLHVALSEGVTTAWWFTASRKYATVRDIHEAWAQGHSLSAVLLSGRRFNYVALATLFVASIPLNGLLLQNAITTYPSIIVNSTQVHVGMSSNLPQGFSADLYGDTIGPYSGAFAMATSLSSGNYESGISFANVYPNVAWYSNPGGCGADDGLGICTANVTGVGFVSECTEELVPYDLDPAHHAPNETFSGRVLSSNVTWDVNRPNAFVLSVQVKNSSACVGSYVLRHCTFRAARMRYPLQIFPYSQLGADSSVKGLMDDQANYLALNVNSTSRNDTFVDYLPETSELGHSNTTFGGLAHYLQGIYNTDLQWTYNGSMWTVSAEGRTAQSASMSSTYTDGGTDDMFGNRSLYSPGFCNNTVADAWSSGSDGSARSTMEFLLAERLRNLLLFSSILQFAYHDANDPDIAADHIIDAAQTVPATRTAAILRYEVLYRYWAGSLAVTLTVMLMITPTFWGFWRLRGIATLSPVDTAIAFGAPVVQTEEDYVATGDARARLREIGPRPLNSTLESDSDRRAPSGSQGPTGLASQGGRME